MVSARSTLTTVSFSIPAWLVFSLATLTSVSCHPHPSTLACLQDGTLLPTALPQDPPLWSPSANFNITILGLDEPGNAALRLAFDQALILAAAFNHDLGYKTLHKAVTAAASSSPSFQCCMCLWTLAYLNAPNLNRGCASDRLAAAQDAAKEASHSCMATENPLERELISAIVARFPANRTDDNGDAFDREFALRMGKIVATSVDNSLLMADLHAIYAEAVMTMNSIAWDYYLPEHGSLRDEAKPAKNSLELALSIAPGHLLALHLAIHLFESSSDPTLISIAESAGDTLRSIIPSDLNAGLGHLLHMPGHAFTCAAGGRYHDAVLAQLVAIEDDTNYFYSCNISSDDYYRPRYYTHKHGFIMWAAIMSGESKTALNFAKRLFTDVDIVEVLGKKGFSTYPTYIYHILLKFGRFSELAGARLPHSTGNDLLDSYVRAIFFFARSYALASQGNCFKSHEDRTQFLSLAHNDTLRGKRVSKINVGKLLDLSEQILESRVCRFCRDSMPDCSEVDHLAAAVDIQDTLPYKEPRYWPDSVRSCLGAALLREDRKDEALAVFEEDLTTPQYPGNGWSLRGKELALRALGRHQEAEEVARSFFEVWKFADVELEEPCF